MSVIASQIIAKVSVEGADKAKSDLAGVSGKINDTTSGFRNLALGAIAAAGVAFVGLGVVATKMAGDFQASITTLKTGAGEAQSNLKLVSDGILKMAVDTGTSTKMLTDGMYMIESAGFHGADGLKVLQSAAQGAKVGNADLASVANGVTTALTDYALPASKATEVTNDLIATVAAGKTKMADLSSAMSTILPTASAVGVSLLDVSSAMATMTGQGTDAASASTYLRQLLMALENPAKKGADALKSVGLSAQQVSDGMKKSLPDTLAMITDAVGKKFPVGSAAYVAALADISGGSKQMQGMLELTGTHLDTFKNNVISVSDAVKKGGNSITGWADVTNDFNFKIDKAREVVETFGIKIGEKLLPIIGKVLDQVMPVVSSFGDWAVKSGIMENAANTLVDALKNISDKVAGITDYLGKNKDAMNLAKIGAIALAGAIGGPLLLSIGAAIVGFLTLDTAASPWIILAVGIGAAVALLIAGFIYLYDSSKPVRDFFANMGPVFSGVGDIFKDIWNTIVSAFAPAWKDLSKSFNDAMPAFKMVGEILGGVVLVAIGLVIGLIAGLAEGIGMAVVGIIGVFNGLVEIIGGVLNVLGGIFLFIMDLITGNFSSLGDDLKLIWSGIVGIFKGAWDVISGIFVTAAGFIGGVIAGFWTAIVKYFTDLYDKLVGHSIIPDMIKGIIDWFSKLPGEVGAWVSNMYNKVVDWFGKLPGRIMDFMSTIKDNIGNAWNWIYNTISGKANEIFNNIMKPFNSARDAIGGVVKSFVNNSIAVFNNGLSGIETFINLFGTGINAVANALGAGNPIGHIPVGRIPSYATGTDSHPGGPAIVGEKGPELVFLPKGSKVAPNDVTMQLLAGGKVPGYAGGIGDIASSILGWIGGGAKSILDNVMSAMNIHLSLPGQLSGIATGMIGKVKDWAVNWIEKVLPKFGGLGPDGQPVNIPGTVQSWITQAMAIKGTPASWANDLGIIAMHESGGNPNAINLTDSNAQAGHPSQGLFQTIPSTFAAYALPGHGNILNPIDNAIAAIGYIVSRYGDVFHVPGILNMAQGGPYIGYANGTNYAQGGMAMVGERGPELMYVPRGAQITPNSSLSPLQGGMVVHVHNYIDGKEITDTVGNRMIKSSRTIGPIRSGR